MPSVFNLSIPELRHWSQRQSVDHRIQNEPVAALNQMMTGIAPPRQRSPDIAEGGIGAAIQFAIVESLGDTVDTLFVKFRREDGTFATEGVAVFVWPNMVNTDWDTFIGTQIVIPIVTVDGVPYATQLPRWEMVVSSAGYAIGDCPFVEE